jgi:hypothetical protein
MVEHARGASLIKPALNELQVFGQFHLGQALALSGVGCLRGSARGEAYG